MKGSRDSQSTGTGIGTLLIFIVMVVVAAISAAIVVQTSGVIVKPEYYKIQIEELPNNDFLLIKVLNYTDNSVLSSVTIKVLEHGEGRLLSGPYLTNESGYTIIQIPHGYDEYFDITGEYKNVTNTITIDKRPILVKSEDKLGSLGIGLIISFVGIAAGVVGWLLRGWINKKAPDIDEEKQKSEGKNPEHQPDSP